MRRAHELAVVLVRTRNPLNLGAAARAMANFGFARLRVVAPYDAAFREARSAVGAADVLRNAEEFGSVADAVADCALVVGTTALRSREVNHPLYGPEEAAKVMRRQRGRVALLFGSEKRGLSNEDLSYCNFLVRIPTDARQPSMNLGQAVAVCLYEIARVRAAVAKKTRANAGELERVTEALVEALRESGYRVGEERVRRFVRRLELGPEEARMFLGMVKQMGWRMKK